MGDAMYQEPEFDQKLYDSWLEERGKTMKKTWRSHFFTFSREYGCDCYATAIEFCNLINKKQKESPWLIFSHPIMEKLISDEKLGADMIKAISEKHYSFVNWFIDGLVPDYLKSDHSVTFERTRTLILNLAEKGNCIMIGGGSQIITRDLDRTKFVGTHIRLVASRSFRIKRIMQRHKLSRGEAETRVGTKQHARDKFIENFTGMSSSDQSIYHLTFNNENNTSAEMAKTLLAYAEIRGLI